MFVFKKLILLLDYCIMDSSLNKIAKDFRSSFFNQKNKHSEI